MKLAKWMLVAALAAGTLALPARAQGRLGDVNLDDYVDSSDASLILAEYASQSTSQGTTFTDPQQKINADVNGNGVVDAIDASVTLGFYSFLSTGGSGRMEDWLADSASSPAVAPPVSSDGNVVDENAHPDDALNKPVLTVTVDGKEGGRTFLLSEARGRSIDCTVKVSGANARYCATGLRVHYSDKLLLATNHLGRIAVEPGEAVKQLARSNPVEDPTAPAGMKGFFAATAGKANYGIDGTMWTFSFTLSDDVEPGDVLPIDIVFRASESGWDRFSSYEDNAASRNMEAYLFTKGIYTAVHTNAFATGADVAACAALAGIAGDADGYIAIADPASVAYPLWVGGVQVCETNKNDILGDGTASFEGTATNGTLSLSNATITATHQFEDEWSSGSNTANVFSGEGFDLTISLAGSNILQNADHPLISDQGHGYGVRSQGNLAITGGGALVAGTNYDGAGIRTDGNLLIDEAVVTAHSGQDGIRVGGSLAISNAVVTACGGSYDGISGGDGDIVIADSVVTATGWAGIEADGHTVAVSGASVVTAEATWGDESEWALCASTLVLGDGLAITEPAGGAFDGGAGCVLDPATGGAAKRVVIAAPPTVYPLWVGGVQVCETNQNDILGDGTASFAGSASGGTLSLSNATITAIYAFEDTYSATVFSGEGFDLAISLAGSNILQNAENTDTLGLHAGDDGIRSRGNLAITGGGALVVRADHGVGIEIDGRLLIDGADVTATGDAGGFLLGEGGLAISNAVVTVGGGGNDGIASFFGDIDIADSVVTATGWAGIEAHGHTVTVSGASVVTAEATWDDEGEWALGAEALVLRDGLAVSEPAGGALGEDKWGTKCVLDPATGKAALRVVIDRRFAVTVVDGSTTNTTARAGETVTVMANAPEEGKAFVEWSPDDVNDVSFAPADAATTTFAMPARAVTVTAVFKEIQIDSIPDQEWTGGPVEPEFRSDTVKFEGTDMVLLPGTDYTVSYTNNVDPGTATATVTMAPPRTGHASATFRILPPPEPPAVSNVVARQRWPWNGLVDVDYEVGGSTTGLVARISFAEQGGAGRSWVASNFLAGAEPSAEPGFHRATWDTKADGATNVVAANVVATVCLERSYYTGLYLVTEDYTVSDDGTQILDRYEEPVDPANLPTRQTIEFGAERTFKVIGAVPDAASPGSVLYSIVEDAEPVLATDADTIANAGFRVSVARTASAGDTATIQAVRHGVKSGVMTIAAVPFESIFVCNGKWVLSDDGSKLYDSNYPDDPNDWDFVGFIFDDFLVGVNFGIGAFKNTDVSFQLIAVDTVQEKLVRIDVKDNPGDEDAKVLLSGDHPESGTLNLAGSCVHVNADATSGALVFVSARYRGLESDPNRFSITVH